MTHQSASFTVDPQYHINSVAELEGGGGRGEAGKFRMLLFLCGSMVGKRIGIYVVSSIDSRRVKLRLLRDRANKVRVLLGEGTTKARSVLERGYLTDGHSTSSQTLLSLHVIANASMVEQCRPIRKSSKQAYK